MKRSILIIEGILVMLLLAACENPKEELEKQLVSEENQVEETVKEAEDTNKEEDISTEQGTKEEIDTNGDSKSEISNHPADEQQAKNTAVSPAPSVKEQQEENEQQPKKQIPNPDIEEPEISEPPDPKIKEPEISEIPDPKIEEPEISEIPDPDIKEPIIPEISIPEPTILEPTEEELEVDSIFVLVSMISLAFEEEKLKADCMVTIEAQNVEEIEGTITLQKKDNTNHYKKVKIWKVKQQTESFFFDTVYALSEQGTYRLTFQGTLKNKETSKEIRLQEEKTF